MKMLVKKIADGLGVFSPIVVLIFVCSNYLETSMKKKSLEMSGATIEKKKSEQLTNIEKFYDYSGFIHSPYMMSKFYDSPDISRFRTRK